METKQTPTAPFPITMTRRTNTPGRPMVAHEQLRIGRPVAGCGITVADEVLRNTVVLPSRGYVRSDRMGLHDIFALQETHIRLLCILHLRNGHEVVKCILFGYGREGIMDIRRPGYWN